MLFAKIKNLFRKKTFFEKENQILSEISNLEKELEHTKNLSERQKILDEIKVKKEELRNLSESNPIKLKYRIKELKEELERQQEQNKESRALVRYYETILAKYQNKIIEEKTAENMKELINYKNIEIEVFTNSLKPKNYKFDENYISVVEKLHSFLKNNFYLIKKIPIKYWLNANEILKAKAGDSLDISIFVCSIMHSLGDFSAKIHFVELEDYNTFAYVKTKYKNRIIIFDVFSKYLFNELIGYEKNILQKYLPLNKKIRKEIYEFNAFEFETK